MSKDIKSLENEIYLKYNDLLINIGYNLQEISNYTQENLLKQKEKNNEINLIEEEEQKDDEFFFFEKGIKEEMNSELGKKRKKYESLYEDDENEYNKSSKIRLNKKSKSVSKKETENLSFNNKSDKLELKDCYHHGIEIIKRINNLIVKINIVINEHLKKINHISSLLDKKDEKLKEEEINNNIQELKYNNGRYVGEIVNKLREGKGIMYYDTGDIYKGDFKNDKREGKGIYYFISGNKYVGDWKDNKKDGEGIKYYKNGDRYEGNWIKNEKEGKGIYFLIMVIGMKVIGKII